MLKISVVIPTFNRKHTLKRALESVLSQTIDPFEIIVMDDGSDDGTREWIEDEYPMVTYIYQSNKGVSSARNEAIRVSKGSWIALLDSDDEWVSEKLERQRLYLKEHSEMIFCHTNEIWIRNGFRVNQKKKHQKHGGYIFNHCLDMCKISPSSTLIKKDVFKDVGLFDETLRVCEDYDLWLRITSKYSILFLDEPLIIKYGGHLDQLSRVSGGIEQYRIKSLEKLLRSKLLDNSQYDLTRNMLIKKLGIFANGLEKRNKEKELKIVKEKMKHWIKIPSKH